MSELSFLLSLLLEQRLSKPVQLLIKDRIREIEIRPVLARSVSTAVNIATAQTASTQKILDEMAAEGKSLPVPEHIAQTAVAAQALASRQQAIAQQVSGVFEKGRTSPRKF